MELWFASNSYLMTIILYHSRKILVKNTNILWNSLNNARGLSCTSFATKLETG